MEIITRKEAKAKGLKKYFTGKPCPRDHAGERRVHNCECVECSKKYREINKERKKQTSKQYRKDNKKQIKQYREHNKECIKKTIKKWREKHPNYDKEKSKKYYKDNPHKLTEYSSRRCKYLKDSKSKWANDDAIKQIYLDRDELNQITKMCGGTEIFEVDHIIPIQGRNIGDKNQTVCGLHCEDNLQIILKSKNRAKKNKYTQDW